MPPLVVEQGRDRSDAVNRGKRFSRGGEVTVREFHSDMILKTSKTSLPLEKEQKKTRRGGSDSGKRAGGHGRSKTDERALSISN